MVASRAAGYMRRRIPKAWRRALAIVAGLAVIACAIGYWQLVRIKPAPSEAYLAWSSAAKPDTPKGAALFAFGDFGVLDLDTLETSALPWPILSAALALKEAGGNPERVDAKDVERALKRFGFLFPTRIADHAELKPLLGVPFGMSIGRIERSFPPIRVTAINVGCASCHAGPAYLADGTPDPDIAVLATPNTSLDLEAFARDSYEALKLALRDEDGLLAAIGRLFPQMTSRERLTLRWVALPKARTRIAVLAGSFDRPVPFRNGAPGLTNGVAALKYQLGVTPRDRFQPKASFVSIPDLGNRFFRSALLADGAYTPKGQTRFAPVTRAAAEARDPHALAAIASFFVVPSMGMTDMRAEATIPEFTEVMRFLRDYRPPLFPGKIDRALAGSGREVYARSCAGCHGEYDSSLDEPRLLTFPNWAGDVGTDRSRVAAFDGKLADAVAKTVHGRRHLDAASTGVVAAPLLSGVWASAPYFVSSSVPTLRHLLEPGTRPAKFMTGGHRLDLDRVGIAGTLQADGTWVYPADYKPFSTPVLIDTAQPGFSNQGHDAEVRSLTAAERDALLEYLKLL
jgi:mono/diheme cytochrome c family protein